MFKFKTEAAMDDFYKNNEKNFTLGLLMKYNATTRSLSYTIKAPQKKISGKESVEIDPGICFVYCISFK